MISQAVILAGGKGSRLGELTHNIPKPLLNVSGKPFIEYLIWNLSRHGVQDIIIMAGFRSEKLKDKYNNKKMFNSFIKVISEDTPLGTAGCLLNSIDELDDEFFILNGDTYFDFDLINLFNENKKFDGVCLLGAYSKETKRFGSINFDEEFYVESFNEKSETNREGVINTGTYLFRKKFLKSFQNGPLSMEEEVFKYLSQNKKLKVLIQEGYFIDIGIPESFQKAEKDFPDIVIKPALFFDRDGTLNYDKGYTHKPEDLKFIDGVKNTIKRAIKKGFYIVVVTNQGGISKGVFSEEQMIDFNNRLLESIRDYGGNIDSIYFCKHHPEAPNFNDRSCSCRKPEPGLILQALKELPIDKEKSIMIGDKVSDVDAGINAGIKALLFEETNLEAFLAEENII